MAAGEKIGMTVQQELLTMADRLVRAMKKGSLAKDESTGWDRYGFDPQKSYLPIPDDADVLLVSRYGSGDLNRARLDTAVYHIPGEGIGLEVRAADPGELYDDGIAFDVLRAVTSCVAGSGFAAVQAFGGERSTERQLFKDNPYAYPQDVPTVMTDRRHPDTVAVLSILR